MSEDRLNSLSLLCVECEKLRHIKFDDIIAEMPTETVMIFDQF